MNEHLISSLLSLATPLFQGFLALALVLVSIMLIRVDRKLSALKSGRDGMAAATVELLTACAKAEAAVKALKDGEGEARANLDARLDEARALGETLKFLSTTARAVAGDDGTSRAPWKADDRRDTHPATRPARDSQPSDALPRSAKVRELSRDGDLPQRNDRFNWGGLR
jgi:hypothetical protein